MFSGKRSLLHVHSCSMKVGFYRYLLLCVLMGCGCSRAPERPEASRPPAPISKTQTQRAPTFPATWRITPSEVPTEISDKGVVSSTDRIASEIGAEILRRGGNAVDAAIAVHFALAVVNPEAGNLGGGGFMLIHASDGKDYALDFREVAPTAATREMYLDAQGNIIADRSTVGPLAAGVPGSVAGMWEAYRRFGSLQWKDLVAPAIELANGVVVHERLADSLADNETDLRKFESTSDVFLPDGHVPLVGQRLVQRDLARTLTAIAEKDRDGFYTGQVANQIATEVKRAGGIITREDLASYEAKWRDPVSFTYRGRKVVSMPPPSSGGATLGELFRILERYNLAALGWHTPEYLHVWAEASRRAFADRNAIIADPDFAPNQPIARMVSPQYAELRARTIGATRATPSTEIKSELVDSAQAQPAHGPNDGSNTTHFSVIDAHGMAVAETTTINSLYGSLFTVRGTGVILNNEMDDFTTKLGAANQFHLVQGEANAIAPHKRMTSSMTPTFVFGPGDRLELVLGSPGGATIISSVAQVISNYVDFRMSPQEALAAPRVHHQHLPDALNYEPGGLDSTTIAATQRLGYKLEVRRSVQGDVHAIFVRDHRFVAVSDPRHGGAPAAVR